MSLFKIQFAAPINKVEFKQIGGKALAEVSVCRKNRTKEGADPTFSWLRISVWDPKDWQTAKMVKGAMIAGCGDFTLRSYEKDGQKRQSAEANCQSFDIEVGGETDAASSAPAPAAAAPQRPAPVATATEDEPPF